MIGIDVLEVDRLERALARRPRLAERLFTDAELAYAAGRARPAMHLAARFCAKEAVAKALALETWAFREVEIVIDANRESAQSASRIRVNKELAASPLAPVVRLTGRAAERAEALGKHPVVSLTHTRSTAAAVAFLA